MKERPILFSGPMVRAILEGRKTQTRRVVKPQPVFDGYWWSCGDYVCNREQEFRAGMPHFVKHSYGTVGDRLWVRENGWERPERTEKMMHEGADTWLPYYYDADGLDSTDHEQFKSWGFKRRPSIHMPRWASRITLEITGIRVERLQEISEKDARSEGVDTMRDMRFAAALGNLHSGACRLNFIDLWQSINGPESWSANPWVWVIEFKRVQS